MALALDARDFDQGPFIDNRRSAQQRPGNQYLVLARQLPDERARSIGEEEEPLRQIGTRGEFGVRYETDQNAVKQIDVIGPEIRGPHQEQFSDPAGGLGAAFGIPCLTTSSSPGISDVAIVMKTHSKSRGQAGFPAI